MPASIGYATKDAETPLGPLPFDRDPVGDEDVRIEIEFCEVIAIDGVDDAFEKVAGKGGEHPRFVIDNSTLPAPEA